MHKHSQLIFTFSLLTSIFSGLAMKAPNDPCEQDAATQKELRKFKHEIKKLNFREYVFLNRIMGEITSMYQDLNESSSFSLSHLQRFAHKSKVCALVIQTSEKSYSLLKELGFPVPKFDEVDLAFDDKEISCLHPAILSQFSPEFQELIKRKKNLMSKDLLEQGANPDNWTTSQRKTFGIDVFNSELQALKTEAKRLVNRTLAYFVALTETNIEKGLGDMSILDMCETVKALEKNSMDFSNVEITQINGTTVIRRRGSAN